MALVSPTKKSDMELLTIWADIIEITHRHYKKTGKCKEYLESFIETYEKLKHRIDTHDYTAQDEAYWRSEKMFKELSTNAQR